ncbi:hypothetical protein GJAV_G00028340 [Gymnothorax javanicus]|nr:hypothetical protein GJAV_G00028340 [Gymnothorax javanicus]
MERPKGAAHRGEEILFSLALNDNKAGMEGLDKDKINKIILETSKGSRFYENELKKEQQVKQRIERMLQQKARITEQQLWKAQAQVEKMADDLERGRDLGRVMVHVDMDAFYAAVEMRDCPELKDKPVGVGLMGMLSTSNYHARKFGVRAAMPGFIAKKLCPSLIIVPPNFEKYRAVSAEVREIFSEYDPGFLPVSLDEAYLDITEHLRQRQTWPESLRTHSVRVEGTNTGGARVGEGSQDDLDNQDLSPVLFEDSPVSPPGPVEVFGLCAEEAVREMRFRIEQRTALTASAGIAPNMMLAKVCSDKNKPNGQYRIPAERQAVMDFIKDLPIRKVSGIGKVTEKMLRALNISTCSELFHKRALLSLLFSEVSWHHFLHISLGLGSTRIERDGDRKSMSTERTFGEMSSAEEQFDLCRELCRDLALDLQREELKGKTVTLKLKNVNFEVKTRASTLSAVVSSEEEIFAVAKDLLKTEIDNASPLPLRLRLMGVRVSGFVSSDDRKPLQKSIVSFLQTGRSPRDLLHSNLPQLISWSPPTPYVRALRCRQAEVGQLSFFQRAQARRLLQQDRPGDPQEPPTSPSSSLQPAEVFTCPVCFLEQESTDLGSFNSHVDECLTAVSQQCRGVGAREGGPGAGVCTGDEDVCLQDEWRHLKGTTAVSEAGTRPAASWPSLEKHSVNRLPASNKQPTTSRTPSLNCMGLKTLESSRPDTLGHSSFSFREGVLHQDTAGEFAGVHLGSKGGETPERAGGASQPALICPVCNMQQDTSDLALFNRHVDVCLNRDVLLELEAVPPALKCNVTSPTKGKGMPENGQNAPKPSSKNKRSGSPPLPPAKKAKVPLHSNTIDRFFR